MPGWFYMMNTALCAGAQISIADKRTIDLSLGLRRILSRRSFISIDKDIAMLYTVALVLIILWLLGLVTSYTLGGFIHILLVIAVVVVLLRIISGRSPL